MTDFLWDLSPDGRADAIQITLKEKEKSANLCQRPELYLAEPTEKSDHAKPTDFRDFSVYYMLALLLRTQLF